MDGRPKRRNKAAFSNSPRLFNQLQVDKQLSAVSGMLSPVCFQFVENTRYWNQSILTNLGLRNTRSLFRTIE